MPLFGPPNIDKMKASGNVKGLIKALKYKRDWKVREAAVKALGDLRDTSAVDTLRDVSFRDDEESVRVATAYALGKIGNETAVCALFLLPSSLIGKIDIVDILVKIPKSSTLEPLIGFLGRSSNWDAERAALALGRIGDARAVDALIARLEDENQDLRVVAAQALGRIGDARAALPLINAHNKYHDQDITGILYRLGYNAAEAQKALEKRGTKPDLDTRYTEAFEALRSLPISNKDNKAFFHEYYDYDDDLFFTQRIDNESYDFASVSSHLNTFLTRKPAASSKSANRSWTVRDSMVVAEFIESTSDGSQYHLTMLIVRIDEDKYQFVKGRFYRGY